MGGIIDQFIGGSHLQFGDVCPKPGGQLTGAQDLVGQDQRLVDQIFRQDMLFCRQGTVLSHENAPGILDRQSDIIIFGNVGRLDQKAEIDQPTVQPFCHMGGISTVDVVGDGRISLAQMLGGLGHERDAVRLPASDIDGSCDKLIRRGKLRFGLLHQFHQFLRPPAKQHPLFCQGHFLASTDQKRLAYFCFQISQLSG